MVHTTNALEINSLMSGFPDINRIIYFICSIPYFFVYLKWIYFLIYFILGPKDQFIIYYYILWCFANFKFIHLFIGYSSKLIQFLTSFNNLNRVYFTIFIHSFRLCDLSSSGLSMVLEFLRLSVDCCIERPYNPFQ